jgi:hypothetical protein
MTDLLKLMILHSDAKFPQVGCKVTQGFPDLEVAVDILGHTGPYWAILGHTGPYWAILGPPKGNTGPSQGGRMPWRHHVSVHCVLDIWVPFQPMAVLLGTILGGIWWGWDQLVQTWGYVIVYPSLARI